MEGGREGGREGERKGSPKESYSLPQANCPPPVPHALSTLINFSVVRLSPDHEECRNPEAGWCPAAPYQPPPPPPPSSEPGHSLAGSHRSHSGGWAQEPHRTAPLLPAPWAAEDTAPHVPCSPGKEQSPEFVNPASGQAAVCNPAGPAPGRGGGSLSAGRGQWFCRAREDSPIPRGGGRACTLWPRSQAPPQAPGREVFPLEKGDLTPRAGEESWSTRLLEGRTPSSLLASSGVDAPATPSSTRKPADYLFQVREGGPAGTPALLPQAPALSRWSLGPPPGAWRHRSAGPPLGSALTPSCTQGCPRGSQSTRGTAITSRVNLPS